MGLALLSLLAVMSWRGLDAMLRSQSQLQSRGDALASLQTSLAQWTLDLQHAAETPYLNAIAWDGRQLRIVRRAASEDALLVVAWGLRAGPDPAAPPLDAALPGTVGGNAGGPQVLRRWQSGPLRDRAALLKAWNEAPAQLDALPASQGTGPGQSARTLPDAAGAADLPAPGAGAGTVSLLAVQDWSLSFHQGANWGRPAVAGVRVTGLEPQLVEPPSGVRLRLELPPGAGLVGTLQLDWANPGQNRGRP